jgi:hypothetical protein
VPDRTIFNAGQEERFDFAARPAATPRGFVNSLACLTPGCSLGYEDSFVYDQCAPPGCSDACDDSDDPGWRRFRCTPERPTNTASLHKLLFKDAQVLSHPLGGAQEEVARNTLPSALPRNSAPRQ